METIKVKCLNCGKKYYEPNSKIPAGYHKRSLAETAMFRYKTAHGGGLNSRVIENQKTEVKIKCKVLNVFRGIAVPNSYKVA